MRTEQITNKTEVIEFDSLKEFYDYCVSTPFNEAFCWAEHHSVSGNKHFTQTENFQEAVELFKNGWSDMATKLVQRLKVIENQVQPNMKPKNVMSMAGYQAIVPVYLNNQPNAMLAKKNVPVKQKVITVNKSIDYNGAVKADTIVEESIKAMQVVKKLEAQGLRVNLNIVLGSAAGYPEKQFILKIRIKSANERLNVSKLAFPLVHPSMLRRLFFRFAEVYPKFTKSFVHGYGRPATSSELRDMFKGEYLLPNFIKKDVNQINSVNDLENI
ncbi:MAG: hypothetical protein PHN69_05315 [Candidatus Pacebacteria bacterium]|nr:hypothetical protein [Candidatus Paceibacterota bacterium]